MDTKSSSAETKRFRICCQHPRVTPIRPSPGDSHILAAIAITHKFWINRTELSYCFVDEKGHYLSNPDGYLKLQMNIVRLAWQNWKNTGINLSFKELTSPKDANFRIAFIPDVGSYSFVGMDNGMQFAKKETHTMNFGWDLRDQACTAEHEIGHALGLEHEHQNPKSGIVWNEKRVIDDLTRSQGWSEQEIRHNVLTQISGPEDKYRATLWDRDSIMHYPFKAGLIDSPVEYRTKDLSPAAYEVCQYNEATNTLTSGLSAHDTQFILKLYPAVDPVSSVLNADQPAKIELAGTAGERQVDFKFCPPESGEWSFSVQGPDMSTLNPVRCTVMISDKQSDFVLDNQFRYADDDSNSRLVLPIKARPSLIANNEYVVSVLFDKTNSTGTFTLKATREPASQLQNVTDVGDIAKYVSGITGIRSGITIFNKTSSDIIVSITKELFADSAAWTTITPGHQDRWGRSTGNFSLDMFVEGKKCTLTITKKDVETAILVNKYNDIQVANAEQHELKLL